MDKLPPNLEVIPAAAEQEAVLANLLELYVHDFSEFLHIKVGADGRFGYKELPLYWREPNRYPISYSCGWQLSWLRVGEKRL